MNYRQRADLILALSFICFAGVFWYWCTHEVTIGLKLALFVFQSAILPTGLPLRLYLKSLSAFRGTRNWCIHIAIKL